jgi:hypothetical protein
LADLLARILQKAASQAGPQQAAPARPDLVPPDSILHDAELLERLRGRLGSLASNLGAKGAAASAAAGLPKLDPAALLTPIDKLIGGSTLLGSKSTIAVVGYTLMSVLQSVGVLGTAAGVAATPTGLVLTLLAGGLGGAGLLSKGDRAIKLLGMIAAK